ncbi:hypothetical protein MNBD_IGNAVI01-3102 [hydrothermal vent metagenome]|uniref:Fibronectin type-III domain-containing protein n=1 Tax=hydrothermal vent metagenome TaxID=652676 RepID=A0A3B1CIG7_9ZZZZ
MRKVIPAILLLFLSANLISAQTVDRRIQIVKDDGVNFVCKIQIALDKDSADIGNAVSRFTFNPNVMSFPEAPKVLTDYMFHDFFAVDYISSVTQPSSGTVSINIVNLGESKKLSDKFIDLVTINFDVIQSTSNKILKSGLMEFFAPFSTSAWDIGSLSISQLSDNYIPLQLFPYQDAEFITTGITFKWKDVPLAESYQLEISTEPSFTQIEQFIDNIVGNEVKVKGLIEGTKYYWRIRSVVADQHSHFSRRRSFVVVLPPPSDLSISTSANNGFVQLNWQNNSSLANNIVIERKTKGSDDENFVVIDTIDANRTSYVDVLADIDKAYFYRVRAINKFVSSPCSDSADISMLHKTATAEDNLPKEYQLQQNYPNPFNPQTTINYSVKEDSYITVTIYTMLGERVTTLVDKTQNAGNYDVVWNASNYPSGIYIYIMTAESSTSNNTFQNVKKMILLK